MVIAIIAILAAILFPVFGRARENARRSSCQSNLKQIGLGIQQYTQDYDEKMPYSASLYGAANFATTAGSINWIAGIQPYVKSWQLFRCPSAQAVTGIPAPNGENDASYMMNGVTVGRSLSKLRNPAELILVHEHFFRSRDAFVRPCPTTGSPSAPFDGPFTAWLESGEAYNFLHFDGGNVLFTDGHVKWRRQNGLRAREFGLNSDVAGEQAVSVTASVDGNQIG